MVEKNFEDFINEESKRLGLDNFFYNPDKNYLVASIIKNNNDNPPNSGVDIAEAENFFADIYQELLKDCPQSDGGPESFWIMWENYLFT